MFNRYRQNQFNTYGPARDRLAKDASILLELEEFLAAQVSKIIADNIKEICDDYNEATFLFPFWQEYPPEERGRQPKGDQYPWIEVGEHVLGAKLGRLIPKVFDTRDPGLPTGPDARFLIRHQEIAKITGALTNAAWLMLDIKSVGPRDDANHTVMSHNQISGDGNWTKPTAGVKNRVMKATGKRESHPFHCTLPPLYVFSDGTIAPTVLMAIKPVYAMLGLLDGANLVGQPLERLDVISIPNGILLEVNPGYLAKHPGLLFPGKDDKKKNPLKVRARISFDILAKIAKWRVVSIPACIDAAVRKAKRANVRTIPHPPP